MNPGLMWSLRWSAGFQPAQVTRRVDVRECSQLLFEFDSSGLEARAPESRGGNEDSALCGSLRRLVPEFAVEPREHLRFFLAIGPLGLGGRHLAGRNSVVHPHEARMGERIGGVAREARKVETSFGRFARVARIAVPFKERLERCNTGGARRSGRAHDANQNGCTQEFHAKQAADHPDTLQDGVSHTS